MRFQATVFIASCVLCLTALSDENLTPGLPSVGSPEIESVISKFNKNLTFYAAFDETSNASITNGSSEPKTQKNIEYGPGKYGKALSNGMIVFPGQENLDSLSGTAILWVEVSPTNNEAAFFPLEIKIHNDAKKSDVMFRIGKAANNALIYAYFQEGGGGPGNISKQVQPHISSKNWKKGEWHLLAFAWNPNSIQLSVDGLPFVKNNTMPLISGKTAQIIIAAASPRHAGAAMSVDEVMIFNRPLADDEINWIWNTMAKYEPLH